MPAPSKCFIVRRITCEVVIFEYKCNTTKHTFGCIFYCCITEN